MTHKTKLSEEVDNYFKLQKGVLDEVSGSIEAGQSADDCFLSLDGLGYTLDQEERSARMTLGVSNLAAFIEELIARGESWTSHVRNLPEDLREQILAGNNGDIVLSGATHRHLRWIFTDKETGETVPLWFTEVIYQIDDPILEIFYIGHEEGHILHRTNNLGAIHSLWTQHLEDITNRDCLTPNVEALESLLVTAHQMSSLSEDSAVTEAVAHLTGLFAVFRRWDPEEAVAKISEGTDTNEFRHIIWLLGYRGAYSVGSELMRNARRAIYKWNDDGYSMQQPIVRTDSDEIER